MDAQWTMWLTTTALALVMLLVLRPVATRVGLIDVPGDRKQHTGHIPLIGGVGSFAALALAWFVLMPSNEHFQLFFWCSFVLVSIGAIDDARDLPAKFRLGAQIAMAIVLVTGTGLYLDGFGDLLGFGVIEFGPWLGALVTIAAVIGATNAFNMMDGIDGLAGMMSLVSLLALTYLFSASPGFDFELMLAFGICVALGPYMAMNLQLPLFRHKIFMGDAGSIFVGFAIVWLLVCGTQSDAQAFRPVTALWIIAVPLMDMVAIMVRRARKGQSLMKPDREHLHHIFLRAGFNQRQALLTITFVATVLAAVGLTGEVYQVPEWIMFAGFLGLFMLYDRALSHVWRLLVLFRKTCLWGAVGDPQASAEPVRPVSRGQK